MKAGLFEGKKLIRKIVSKNGNGKLTELASEKDISGIAICDVSGGNEAAYKKMLAPIPITFVSEKIRLPFLNQYKTKTTLGADRIAAVAGAMEFFPEKNILIINAGTCITYDIVTSKKNYEGGVIAPGIRMRLESMHEQTAKLPLIKNMRAVKIPAKTTEENMLAGSVVAAALEADGFVRRFEKQFGKLNVILTGGDAAMLQGLMESRIFAEPNLTLYGLNALHKLNQQ